MTDDLVKRLRSPEVFLMTSGMISPVAEAAADRIEQDAQHIDEMYALVAAMNADHTASKTRIEQLEAALREIINKDSFSMDWAIRTARKALEGKDD